MSMDQLMVFRTIYLRSVAQAWISNDFRKDLIDDPIHAFHHYFGFRWPWSNICDLKVEPSTQLRWLGNNWVWARNQGESLTLFVPLHPPAITVKDRPELRATALADYYRQRSSLFSDNWGTPYGPHGPIKHGAKDGEPPTPGAKEVTGERGLDSDAPLGGYIPPGDVFASFRVVLLAAIAKAWEDSTFREKLELDAATALHSIQDYALPWKLLIRVQNDTDAKWHPPKEDSEHPSKHQSFWNHETKNGLRLLLPEKPELTCEPIALAAYNAMGAQYPFTCCCFD